MQETSTRSPGSSVVTALPISVTVPTASWPRIVPGVTSGTSPLRMCRSVPQIVEESILTIASVGCSIFGSGTSSQARCPGPWYTSAFISRLLSAVELLVRVVEQVMEGGAHRVLFLDRACGLEPSADLEQPRGERSVRGDVELLERTPSSQHRTTGLPEWTCVLRTSLGLADGRLQ